MNKLTFLTIALYKNSTFPKQISYVYKTQLLKWTKLCDPKIEPTKKIKNP